MTELDRFDLFERRISEAIDAIAAARTPAYLDDILRLTERTSQRRRWTYPEGSFKVTGIRFALGAAVVVAAVVAIGALGIHRTAGPAASPPSPTNGASPRLDLHALTAAPDLLTPRGWSTMAITLRDGRVLILGGDNTSTPTAEVFDPSTGRTVKAGPLAASGDSFDAAMLGDGSILVVGRLNTQAGPQPATAQRFDPTSMTFEFVGPTAVPRFGSSLTSLRDGRVLIMGGVTPAGINSTEEVAIAEIFDPATGHFSPSGTALADRRRSAGLLLPDGRVLFIALQGVPPNTIPGLDATMIAELYDPAAGSFTDAGSGQGPGGIPVRLGDGRVMILGGHNTLTHLSTARFWDGASILAAADPPVLARTATTLDDGRLLVTGGPGDGNWLGVYDPASGTWTESGVSKAWLPAVTKLLDGRVLLVGGFEDGDLHDGTDCSHCQSAPIVATMQYFN
jgi:hypothetical protein